MWILLWKEIWRICSLCHFLDQRLWIDLINFLWWLVDHYIWFGVNASKMPQVLLNSHSLIVIGFLEFKGMNGFIDQLHISIGTQMLQWISSLDSWIDSCMGFGKPVILLCVLGLFSYLIYFYWLQSSLERKSEFEWD